MEVLLARLLKWQLHPGARSPSWRAAIRLQRAKIIKLLREMPSLRNFASQELTEAYDNAVILAGAETELREAGLPTSCPFALAAILDVEFSPE